MQLHLLVQATHGREDGGPDEFTTLAAAQSSPCIHFIETEPSVLRDVPWIQLREHKVQYDCMCILSRVVYALTSA